MRKNSDYLDEPEDTLTIRNVNLRNRYLASRYSKQEPFAIYKKNGYVTGYRDFKWKHGENKLLSNYRSKDSPYLVELATLKKIYILLE